ncbi:MAG: hypothetical protein R3360_07520, partial [Alphaproteobacteria bacterium]|nr:hypothetical protein [Alphaproteobacteria bacterium]
PQGARACEERPCLLLQLDLNSDGFMEYAVVTAPPRSRFMIMIEQDGSWEPLYTSEPGGSPVSDSIYDAIRAGDYELVDPAYSDIRIGDRVFRY